MQVQKLNTPIISGFYPRLREDGGVDIIDGDKCFSLSNEDARLVFEFLQRISRTPLGRKHLKGSKSMQEKATDIEKVQSLISQLKDMEVSGSTIAQELQVNYTTIYRWQQGDVKSLVHSRYVFSVLEHMLAEANRKVNNKTTHDLVATA